MRIAYLSGAYIPSRGANTMHVMGMCQAMAQLGHNVTLYARPGDLESENDFTFYDVNPIFDISKQSRPQLRWWGAVVNAVRTRRALAEGERAELIYAREVWALSLVADLGVPFIFETHWRPRNFIQTVAEARLLRHPQLQRVVFISEALRKIYVDVYPWLDMKKTMVAHDAANIAKSVSASVSRPAIFERGIGLQVGYIGSLHTGCGVAMIVEIATMLPEADFHIFGGTPSEVADWSVRTAEIDNVYFHGFVPPGILPQVYEKLDVVLAPYQSNTPHIDWISPMKLFEYMAHRKAIVCSDFPVLREILVNGVTGILVRPDCVQDWVRALQNLDDDESLSRRISVAANDKFRQKFTWLKRAETVLDGSNNERLA